MIKVFIAGHNGMAGSALARQFSKLENYQILTRSRSELDLRDRTAVLDFFEKESPDWVIIAAALVGGIKANSTQPVEFFLDNSKIQNNLFEASHIHDIKKLLFLGSNCIYPKSAEIPISEDELMGGAVQETNEAYALAKIGGIKLCQFYQQQYQRDFFSVIPVTLFGQNDNYHMENAHVLPMLLRRFHESKLSGAEEVVVWGSGKPLREFLYADQMAEACRFLMEKYSYEEIGSHINLGPGNEISILELANSLKDVVGYQGEVKLDQSKPDGIFRKTLDCTALKTLGWSSESNFMEQLKMTYEDFLNNPNTRL